MLNFFRKKRISKYVYEIRRYLLSREIDRIWEDKLENDIEKQKNKKPQEKQDSTDINIRYSKARSYDPLRDIEENTTVEKITKPDLRYALP